MHPLTAVRLLYATQWAELMGSRSFWLHTNACNAWKPPAPFTLPTSAILVRSQLLDVVSAAKPLAVYQVAAVVDWLKACMEGSHLRGPANVLVRCADLLAADVDVQLRPVCDFLLFAGFTSKQVRCCSAISHLGFRFLAGTDFCSSMTV